MKIVEIFLGECWIMRYWNTYNSADLITSITYPSGQTVNYTYDKLAQLESIPSYLDGNTGDGFAYNSNGAVTDKYFNNNVNYSYTYNNRNWLETVTNDAGHDFDYNYTYQANGNLDQIKDLPTQSILEDFGYDGLNRLTSVNYTDNQYEDRNYSYDKVGNRTAMNNNTYNYTLSNGSPVNNRLLGLNNSTDYTYDANGNITIDNDQGFVYEYDCLPAGQAGNNRLKNVKANTWKTWAKKPTTPYTFEVASNQLHIKGNDNDGWKYARKDIAPVKIAGSGDVITLGFDFMINNHVDMDYLRINLEDSTNGTGFYINYYKRSNKLLVRQFHDGNVYSDIYLNTGMTIPLNTTSYVKLTIDASANTVMFEYDRPQNHEEATVALDQQVTRVNSIKTFLIEADYSVDNIQVSTTAYSPYTYTEDFNSPELNGFAGPFVSYLYNTEDERVMKISP